METSYTTEPTKKAWSRWTSIVSSMEEIYTVTKKLYLLVSKSVNKEGRDQLIEDILLLLNQREELLSDLEPCLTENDGQLFKQVIVWNETINETFNQIKQTIQKDMVTLKKSKATNHQYINPYQDISTIDGMFYDKRK